ncbi:hypothetical protein K1T71_011488 [Dendrolimus kikuchii]|uniref:Uncharacterized protein n=1 Tax=Dendrolimus kikuchii TaxID=765133 RepID=A0ACC1CP26_9NEOP|nr:hypothetical protein K1T71_011488 [Dendrolimus kikuchii]
MADTADKSVKMIKKDGRAKMVLVETGDALLWQTLASIIIPGVTLNRICAYSQRALCKYASKVPVGGRNWMTVGIGLASIPIIVRPIDAAVTALMNVTYRRWIKV